MKKMVGILVVGVAVLFAANVWAVPTLYFQDDDGNALYVADGDPYVDAVTPYDANPAAGAVTFIGAWGDFTLNVTTGITKPAIGSATDPEMDLNSVDVTTETGGSLLIAFSETGFSMPAGVSSFQMNIGGTTAGQVTYWGVVDTTDALFGSGTYAQLGPFSPIAFSGSTDFSAPVDGSFSLTQVVEIIHEGQGTTSFDATLNTVPEPGTMLLLGSGLVGLGVLRRRKARK